MHNVISGIRASLPRRCENRSLMTRVYIPQATEPTPGPRPAGELSAEPATPPPASAGEPLFVQVRNKLRDDILARRLPPGVKLPSEAKLQAAFGVSRITIRQALSELQAEGLVETFNGKGSFVTRPANAPLLGLLAGFNAVMHARGLRTGGRLLDVRTEVITPQVMRALGMPADSRVMEILILRLVEDAPTAHARLVCEPSMGNRLLELGVESTDVMTLLEDKLELWLERSHVEASAVGASAEHAALLEIATGEPLLRMRFVPYDLAGRPLLFAEMHFRHDRFSYRTVIRR